MKPIIRTIHSSDNQAVKDLIIRTLSEFGLEGEGYACADLELEDMFSAYSQQYCEFYVVESAGEIVGVGGFASLEGTKPGSVAELRKMYFSPKLRGQGYGQKLIDLCLNGAIKHGFSQIYLETDPGMQVAQKLYLKNGFKHIESRMGNTGHSKCAVFMLKSL